MEVKIIVSLGGDDAPTLSELLAVLAKGKITSSVLKQEEEKQEVTLEMVEDAKQKKSSKKVTKKQEASVEVESTNDATSSNTLETTNNSEEVAKKPEESIKKISLDDIRAIARKLADAGRQKDYKPILEKYGYAKVNLIEEKDYSAIYSEMSALVGEDNA